MSALGSVNAVLASAVANTGTVAVPYPSGLNQAALIGSTGGSVVLADNERFPQAASGAGTVAFAFGASEITITNNSGISWPAGSRIIAGFGNSDISGRYNPQVRRTPALVALTAATGTAGNTINDVGASFNQTTLNNNTKSLAEKINEIIAALKGAGINV